MKTSEMIAMLEKNPKLRFTSGGEISTMEAICRSGNIELYHIPAELRYEFRRDRDWQLVREPVTWQEALQAWIDGKEIEVCECAGCESIKEHKCYMEKQTIDGLVTRLCRQQFKTAKWYINE